MTILDKIIAFKKKEVAKIKKEVPIKKLVESPKFKRTPISLKKSLLEVGSTGIIAEFKRQSPSKGIINDKVSVTEVTQGYLDANVAAQSILTDTSFFGGSIADLLEAKTINQYKPILRKDFVIDGFQIVEAKAIGADVVLLIATCLSAQELKNYGNLASDPCSVLIIMKYRNVHLILKALFNNKTLWRLNILQIDTTKSWPHQFYCPAKLIRIFCIKFYID